MGTSKPSRGSGSDAANEGAEESDLAEEADGQDEQAGGVHVGRGDEGADEAVHDVAEPLGAARGRVGGAGGAWGHASYGPERTHT